MQWIGLILLTILVAISALAIRRVTLLSLMVVTAFAFTVYREEVISHATRYVNMQTVREVWEMFYETYVQNRLK
jgi:hypothetical protein